MKIGHWIPAYNETVNVNVVSQVLKDATSAAQAGHSYRFWAQHSCDLVWLRNFSLDRALHLGLDYLLMQDADCFSDNAEGVLMPLLETAEETGATVTGALVTMRTNPPRANVWPCHPGKCYEADKIGTGIVLINLAKIREWYDDYEGPCFCRTYKTDKGVIQAVGLDVFFSYVVRDHKQMVVCDARIPTTHIDGTHRHRFDGEAGPDAAGSADVTDTLIRGVA